MKVLFCSICHFAIPLVPALFKDLKEMDENSLKVPFSPTYMTGFVCDVNRTSKRATR